MNPTEVGESYDAIADRWQDPAQPLTGLEQHRRAIRFLQQKRFALDVGCGCNGRLIDLLQEQGFVVEGVDISQQMIDLARKRHPTVQFHHADICQWEPPRKYDFITGWDSIWHVPLESQAHVLQKLCDALFPGGIFIFTIGGVDQAGDARDQHMGVPMYHASLGVSKTLALLAENGCVCRHLEYDQYPQLHVCLVAQKLVIP